MGLPKVDTRWATVANGQDPDVEPKSGDRDNEWLEAGVQCVVRSGATTLRVRALTGLELHAVERGKDEAAAARWLAHLARAGLHLDDRSIFDELPWQYQLSLGALVSEWSSPKPDPITAPA